MSISNVRTIAFQGMQAIEIDVQIHIGNGLPFFAIVGLPDKSIAEAKERIRAVFNTIGLSLPPKRITVNMSPASLQKEGSHYDLPIAVGILIAMNIISAESVKDFIVLGELSLSGKLQAIPGVLVSAMYAFEKDLSLLCPYKCAKEARIAGENLNLIALNSIMEIISFFKGEKIAKIVDEIEIEEEFYDFDMSEVSGQESAKRAFEIAAVFGMHILLIGPPGIGKSMLAKRMITILPPLNAKKSLEVSMIYSIANKLNSGVLKRKIPYREPHHSASLVSLVGGGAKALPGEISLAHNGVLFLDELAEYSKALEGLRQSMESGEITISRAHQHITYPANAMIIAAMNPCKCGYLGTEKECKRVPICGQEYQNKISGPIFDRFDLIIHMNNTDLFTTKKGESSKKIKERVMHAKKLYEENYSQDINKLHIDKMSIDKEAFGILLQFCEQKKINQRSYMKIIRIAKVISLLDNSLKVEKNHISEAMMYRRS